MYVLSQDGQILTDGTLEILPEYYTEKEVEEGKGERTLCLK